MKMEKNADGVYDITGLHREVCAWVVLDRNGQGRPGARSDWLRGVGLYRFDCGHTAGPARGGCIPSCHGAPTRMQTTLGPTRGGFEFTGMPSHIRQARASERARRHTPARPDLSAQRQGLCSWLAAIV